MAWGQSSKNSSGALTKRTKDEAREHFTARDAVSLMARLVFLPIADRIESETTCLYDGAGGMLTVAEDVLYGLAEERRKRVSTHLYGQEINAKTHSICKADLLLKGEGEAADNIVGGLAHSPLLREAFPMREFNFIISNPPNGKSWKTDPIRGSHGVLNGSEHQTVECQPDSKLRDTEQIPFVGEGGLEGFLRRKVLRYAVDAWCLPKSVEIGYEISFDRHVFEPQPMRTLDDT